MNIHAEHIEDAVFEEWGCCDRNLFWLHEPNLPITGGKIARADIDALADHPEITAVMVSGLDQDTFEYFVETYGPRLRYIHFFKNKMVEDLSPLGALPELEGFRFFHNQRVTRLWDMRSNKNLKFIDLADFTRLHDLEGVQRAPALEWFSFGDRIWSTSVADSYCIFRDTGVRRLDFTGKAIADMDLSFVLDMPMLEELNLPTNVFTTEQNAWVVANRPDVRGYSLRPSIYFPKDSISEAQALIVGKRKPSINIAGNEERIRRYEARFQELVAGLKGAPWSSVTTDAKPTARTKGGSHDLL